MSKSELKRYPMIGPMIGSIASVVAALAMMASANLAWAQQDEKIRRIGFLSVFSHTDRFTRTWDKAFRQGLRDHGWVVGKNISISYRWMGRERERLPALADELLGLDPEIVVVHGGAPARILTRKSKTIPVVMAEVSDAIGRGVVRSLARPGGNITGLTSISAVLDGKRLELLKEIVPGLSVVAVFWTPKNPASKFAWQAIQEPARRLGLRLHSMKVRSADEFAKALDEANKAGAGALFPTVGMSTRFKRKSVLDLVTRSRLPTIFGATSYVKDGGLVAYARDMSDLYRRAATYVHKILNGAKPADLPIEQPTRFRLAVNLKTAKTLGITIPRSILLRADEVIE